MAALTPALTPAVVGRAGGPPVLISVAPGLDAVRSKVVRDTAARFRTVVQRLALPSDVGETPEAAASEQRAQAIALALERARQRESEAAWDECVREAASAMGDAIEQLAARGEWRLLRDLHVQAGVCMSLSNQASGARLHFLDAALLDESMPALGLHREEAERAQLDARHEVLSRPKGTVRIITDPPGARVWLDGRALEGETPLDVEARLGDHFLSVQRFRYETNTEVRLFQPSASVRIVLEPARRTTLAAQLAEREGQSAKAPRQDDELLLAQAAYSRAEQLIQVDSAGPHAPYALRLLDVSSGRALRSVRAPRDKDESALGNAVCDLLRERCEPPKRIPWYVWPLAGAVVAAGAVTATVLLQNARDTRFCPPSGCR